MTSKIEVHLVDGTFELFRAFYGSSPAAKAPGSDQEVGATRALLGSLNSLLRQPEVSHVAIAFDHVIESFRNQLFDGYKTGAGIEPELYSQFGLAEEAARALGVVVWPMIEFEADDALATAAVRYGSAPEVERVVICSPDKDLAQVVSGEQIVCLDRIRGKWLNEEGVKEKFGVPPSAIADYLALVGDSADGIPGVPRWGAKSSGRVLSHYGSLEAIPVDATNWQVSVRGAAGLAENLAGLQQEALLYKRLATLRLDVPLKESVEDLRWRGPRQPEFDDLCERLSETRLPDRLASPKPS